MPITERHMPDLHSIVRDVKSRHGVRVRRWRTTMSGCAWRVDYSDGRQIRWIEAPYPKTPISLAIFLHEVGHHAIGFEQYPVECEEEYHVWQWALAQMRRYGVAPDASVERRFERSMQYAVNKEFRRRRGEALHLPPQLQRFQPRAA
jgi:hypothetical protein